MKTTLGILLLSAFSLSAANSPMEGTWKLNVSKSKFVPGPAPHSQTVVITEDKVEVSGVDAKGQQEDWSYIPTQGKEAMITGMPDAKVVETRKGNTFDHLWMVGKGKEKGHGVISSDGKTMTYTLKGTNAEGKKMSERLIYEKQ